MTTEPQRRERARRLARTALGLYGMGDDAEVELLRNDFVQVFRVRSATHEEFALRLYGLPEAVEETGRKTPSDDLRSPEVLRSQLLWLSALRRDTGLLVPEPVATLEGELLGEAVVEDTPSGTPWRRRSALLGWVAGTPRHEDLSESDSKMAGTLLARMHEHSEGYGAPEGSAFSRWDWRWPFGEGAPLWDEGPLYYSEEEMAVFEEGARRVRERLEELGEGRRVFGVIHRDPNTRNLLFSGEGGVGLIDFDMCGLGHYLFDLSVFRRSFNTRPEDSQEPPVGGLLRRLRGRAAPSGRPPSTPRSPPPRLRHDAEGGGGQQAARAARLRDVGARGAREAGALPEDGTEVAEPAGGTLGGTPLRA